MRATNVAGLEIPVSQAALGTMTFGDTVDARTAAAILDAALEAGITVVDTANVYSGGISETMLASLLPARRDSVLLATKVGMPHADAGGLPPLSREGLLRSVRGSLRRLASDRVDLLYLHQPDRATPVSETLEAVKDLMDEGLIGAYGVSNYAAWQIGDLRHAATTLGIPGPTIAQQLYNLTARRLEEEYFEFASEHRLFTMVYNPLAGGLLTGRHKFAVGPTEGRFALSSLAETYRNRYWDPRIFAAVDSFGRIAAEEGMALPELALRWVDSSTDVGSILLGASRVEQLEENITALAKGPLPARALAACDEVGKSLRGPMPNYNR